MTTLTCSQIVLRKSRLVLWSKTGVKIFNLLTRGDAKAPSVWIRLSLTTVLRRAVAWNWSVFVAKLVEVTCEFNVIFQEITRLSFKVCIKDSQGISKSHDPVTVDYAIVGGILMFPLQGAVIEKKRWCRNGVLKPFKRNKDTSFADLCRIFWTYCETMNNFIIS